MNQICSKMDKVLPWPILHPSTKFYENWASSFYIILLTNEQTSKWHSKHNLHGRGNNTNLISWSSYLCCPCSLLLLISVKLNPWNLNTMFHPMKSPIQDLFTALNYRELPCVDCTALCEGLSLLGKCVRVQRKSQQSNKAGTEQEFVFKMNSEVFLVHSY